VYINAMIQRQLYCSFDQHVNVEMTFFLEYHLLSISYCNCVNQLYSSKTTKYHMNQNTYEELGMEASIYYFSFIIHCSVLFVSLISACKLKFVIMWRLPTLVETITLFHFFLKNHMNQFDLYHPRVI
jgi:hypothetical protein